MRQAQHIGMMAGAALAVLSGCAPSSNGGLSQPPRAKPATLPVQLEGPTEDTSVLAGLSTKSGELMILENDGSVTKTQLDSPRGRQTLSGDEVYSLASVLVSDDSMPLEALPKPPPRRILRWKNSPRSAAACCPRGSHRPHPRLFWAPR